MLTLTDVVKSFKTGDQTIKPVNGVGFSVEQGTFAAILGKSGSGKSGSGKSTLLSLLGALEKATSGDVVVDGVNISKLPDGKLTAYRRDDIGFVFQSYNLIPNLSALENVMLPMEFAAVSRAKRSERAANEQPNSSTRWGSPRICISAKPTGSRAGYSSAWPLPGPWPTTRS